MYRLAIFDLDGTLINSIYDLADAVNTALAERGYPTHETEKYYYFVGNGAIKLCERALPEDKRSEKEILSLHRRFSEVYDKICLDKTLPYEGIPQVLEKLKNAGVKCAVASNKPDSFSNEIVSVLFEKGSFDLVMGKREGVPTKPSPEIIENIISELGMSKDDAIIIGDSCVDVQTAHNAGLQCIGCVWGFRGEQELRENGCEHIAYEPEDIVKFVTSL